MYWDVRRSALPGVEARRRALQAWTFEEKPRRAGNRADEKPPPPRSRREQGAAQPFLPMRSSGASEKSRCFSSSQISVLTQRVCFHKLQVSGPSKFLKKIEARHGRELVDRNLLCAGLQDWSLHSWQLHL